MKKNKIFSIVMVLLLGAVFISCSSSSSGISANSSGGDAGSPIQGQGNESKAAITIAGKTFEKTKEIVIIPAGKIATINMADDSSWNTYLASTELDNYNGVFLKDRKVQLSPYAISAYKVTQELYEAVMENNPSEFRSTPAEGEEQKYRPVETVSWYDAVNFCNELIKKTMSETDCVYTITDVSKDGDNITSATVEIDITKKGYRLPTEAEWEFAARGGDPTAPDWKFAYSGVQTKKSAASFTDEPCNDEELEKYGWDTDNSGELTHEVGKKIANKLGLYDMSGNVCEWCWDDIAEFCSIFYRDCSNFSYCNNDVGFRLARSL